MSSMLYLHRRTGAAELLQGALRAADFLVGQAWDPKLRIFPFELPDAAQDCLAYFFDSGIIVRGLLAAHRATDDRRYFDAAIAGGRSMLAHFPSPDGTINPILRLPELAPVPHTAQWSRSPGCYQLKSAMAWHDLAVATGDATWEEAYTAALNAALSSHESFLPAETPEKTMDRLHAYCYFLEGLLPAVERSDVGAAMRQGISRVSGYLREIRPQFERSDVYGQLLRVRLFAASLTGLDVDEAQAQQEAEQVAAFQAVGGPEVGGYWFGRKAGQIIPHANPVSSAFCSQALEMWSDRRSRVPLVLADLI
ncbi:MAG TPA: hypothetical protein VES20_13225 [Bryobacteraceae bacterium]|nr:hypothetical protein [Bryobacteraceae bacterium]